MSDHNRRHMKDQAGRLGVDLLLIDTGILQLITNPDYLGPLGVSMGPG